MLRGWPSPFSTRRWSMWLTLDLHRLQFLYSCFHFSRLGCHAMPFHLPLHERDAFSLDGVRDDARGMVARIVPRFFQRRDDLVEVMAIDLDHVPVEGAEFVAQRTDVQYLCGEVIELLLVVVDDQRQVVELVEGREHRSLPVLAFLDLAVAGHHEGVEVGLVQLSGERNADPDGETLT